MSTVHSPKIRIHGTISRAVVLGALGFLIYGCSAASDPAPDTTTPTNPSRTGGKSGTDSGGSTGTSSGGSTGSTSSGGSTGSSGGSVGSGGTTASGGSTGTSSGGAGGPSETGGSTGSGGASASGGAGGSTSDGPAAMTDAPSSTDAKPSSGEKHPVGANNALTACKTASAYHLDGASATDFCAFYESVCHYDPTGKELNAKGQTPAQRADAKSNEPWFYKDYADCIAKYTAAKPGAQSCRAGQLCRNKADGCTHATGHFADCP